MSNQDQFDLPLSNDHPTTHVCEDDDSKLMRFNPNSLITCTTSFNGGHLFLGELDPPNFYNSTELQAQHLVNGGGTPLASEITSLESETFRVTNKLTTEERKEKIHRYLKKRNERNFSKKIKYACRKTLADSRPRVRGRFAKNDEFGENNNRSNGHEEEDAKSFQVVVKEEDENFESSDIFAHISGVNSFKCNYPIQSWM
ncbi:hypothetical protein L1987_67276 [Smallanthus sonchifolius]|uniref:Uncharacterized protein n=1 Tax=Smallanthus sonchifolius TaxID=185202 RepID=A0ACB9B2T5_9ASTR|nr:hypothetical protein L1987_67276 [Smallanthus sonchifolius]